MSSHSTSGVLATLLAPNSRKAESLALSSAEPEPQRLSPRVHLPSRCDVMNVMPSWRGGEKRLLATENPIQSGVSSKIVSSETVLR